MNPLLKSTKKTLEDIIKAVINNCYIVDLGIVDKVSDDEKYVDVIHLVKPEYYNYENKEYEAKDQVISKEVEVFYPGSSYLQIEWKLKKNDFVLLLGTRDHVSPARDKTKADTYEIASHYNQENLKAIPLSASTDAKVKINVDDSKLTIETDSAYDVEITGAKSIKFLQGTESFVKGDTTKTNTDTLLNLIKSHTHLVSGTDSDGDTFSVTSGPPLNASGMDNPFELSTKIKGE